jgi:UDP-3-O-[3-hydroxymyristoyl] glucosamine N-acyltransferase
VAGEKKTMKVDELAGILGGKWQGDGRREIRGVAALQDAGPDDLTFVEGDRALALADASPAGCILVAEGSPVPGHTTIEVKHPKLAFIRAVEVLLPHVEAAAGIHPTAIIAPDVHLAADVSAGPYVVIERGAKVGEGTRLGAGVCLGEGVQVGAQCVLYPRVVVYPGARLGDRVILHAGVVIGSDGFGYVLAEGRYQKFPQLGQVIIGDDVEIGSNTTIDRGSLGKTSIGEGTKLDNLVHVAHNVHIGKHCVIAAQTGISGSVEIGDQAVIGGQVGIGDHVRIEGGTIIGSQAGILPGKIVRRGLFVWGTPARPLDEFKRIYAHMANLPELTRKVKDLSRRISGEPR